MMFLRTTLRVFKFALQHAWRNFWLSLATIIVVSLMLFSVNIVSVFRTMSDLALNAIEQRIDVSVVLRSDVTSQEADVFRDDVKKIDGVKEVTIITPEETLTKFKERYVNQPVILQSLEQSGGNPFGYSARIQATDTDVYDEIMTTLDRPQYARLIDDKNYQDNAIVIERVSTVAQRAQEIGLIVAIVFALVASLVVFNNIRVAIYTHKEELAIMKLVGASNAFVRIPFFIEEALYGFFGGLIAALFTYAALAFANPYLTSFFGGMDFMAYFWQQMWWVILLQAVAGIVVCMVSGSIAVGRHLKV